MTIAMMKTFKIVPIPGFCFINIHKNKTIRLIIKVVLPTERPVMIDNPSDRTSHGEFPVEEIKIKASPKPKQKRPNIRKNRVWILGLKFKGVSELHDFLGISLIFKKLKKENIKNIFKINYF